MKCPYCRQDSDKVVDTRPGEDGALIRRRRECLACGRRYTTHERVEETPIRVIKKNGAREIFSREKLLTGINRAIEKRPVGSEQVEAMISAIERDILDSGEREIASQQLGELVMKHLRAMDEVAYVRFASVYREFKAVEEFVREVNSIFTHERTKGTTEA